MYGLRCAVWGIFGKSRVLAALARNTLLFSPVHFSSSSFIFIFRRGGGSKMGLVRQASLFEYPRGPWQC